MFRWLSVFLMLSVVPAFAEEPTERSMLARQIGEQIITTTQLTVLLSQAQAEVTKLKARVKELEEKYEKKDEPKKD